MLTKRLLNGNQVVVVGLLTICCLVVFKMVFTVYNSPTETEHLDIANLESASYLENLKNQLYEDKRDQILMDIKADIFREYSYGLYQELKNSLKQPELSLEISDDISNDVYHESLMAFLTSDTFKPPIDSLDLEVEIDTYLFNQPEFHSLEYLSNATTQSILAFKRRYTTLMSLINTIKYPSSRYKDNGIVILNENLVDTLVSVKIIREEGSMLPIEVMITDNDDEYLSICSDTMPIYDAKCVDISDYKLPTKNLHSLAILVSSFENIVFLDGNTIPTAVVGDQLFNTTLFEKSHLIIWPHVYKRATLPLFYDLNAIELGEPIRRDGMGLKQLWNTRNQTAPFNLEGSMDSSTIDVGQILISKKYHFQTVLLSIYYDYYPVFDTMLDPNNTHKGETLMASSHVLNTGYYMVDWRDPLNTDVIAFQPDYMSSNNVMKDVFDYMITNNIDSRVDLFLQEEAIGQLKSKIMDKISSKITRGFMTVQPSFSYYMSHLDELATLEEQLASIDAGTIVKSLIWACCDVLHSDVGCEAMKELVYR